MAVLATERLENCLARLADPLANVRALNIGLSSTVGMAGSLRPL